MTDVRVSGYKFLQSVSPLLFKLIVSFYTFVKKTILFNVPVHRRHFYSSVNLVTAFSSIMSG